jgi:GAF domain-containing protein
LPGVLGVAVDITERKKTEEELLHRVNELEVLYESGLALSRLLEPREIGQKMMDVLSRKLAWHHAAIRLYHPKTDTVEVLAVSHPGMDPEKTEEERQRLQKAAAGLGKGLSGWVIKHGKPVRSGDVTADKRYLVTYPGIHSGIYVPIRAGDRTIGSIAVESETADAFTEQDERILTTLASQAAVAFENARLYQEALRAAERRAILHRAGQEISAASLDLESVYASIHRAAAELMPFEVLLIGRHDRARQEIETIYTFDSGEHYPSIRIPVGQGISGMVVQDRTSLCIQDYRKEKRGKIPAFGKGDARSILAVPMFTGVEITGVISVQSYKPGMVVVTK